MAWPAGPLPGHLRAGLAPGRRLYPVHHPRPDAAPRPAKPARRETSMSVSMYQASVPAILKMLNAMSLLLDKAAAYCEAKKIDEKALLETRLFPNMIPLRGQFQIVSDSGKGITARLAQ